MESLIQDLHYAFRSMWKHPAFTVAVVLSLGLGIGANTAIYSVIDALMLRSLPVREPDRLVTFEATARMGAATYQMPVFPYPAFSAIRQSSIVFDDMTAIFAINRSNIRFAGSATSTERPVRVALVSGTYFSTFGVQAIAGQAFTADDDRTPGGDPVALISYRYWQSQFASSSDAVGRTFELNGTIYTIRGILPRHFTGDEVGNPVDLWIPIVMQSQVMPERSGLLTNPNPPWVRIVARLKPGASHAQAVEAIDAAYRRSVEERVNLTPQMLDGLRQSKLTVLPAGRGSSNQRAQMGTPLLVLMTVVGLVLLIACANVANLLLARATTREKEIGVRVAIGAGRGQIVRQLLTESVALAAVSGILGFWIAGWGTAALGGMVSSGLGAFEVDLSPNLRVCAFTMLLSLLTGVLFGLAPALRAADVNLASGLRSGTGRVASRFRLHRALVVAQVAVSVILVIGAGLFVQTLRNLASADLGYDRDHVYLVSLATDQAGLNGAQAATMFPGLLQRAGAIPGVTAVSLSSAPLLAGGSTQSPVRALGRSEGENDVEQWNILAPGYFSALGMHLLAGRDFGTHDDSSSQRVAVVNETFAMKYFGTRNALGRRFGMRRDQGNEIEVVGVVRDAKYNTMRDQSVPLIYLPYPQEVAHLFPQAMNVVLRVAGAPAGLAAGVRDAVRDVNPALPVLGINSVEEAVGRTLTTERLVAWLSGLFGGVAVVLACIGLYGVVSYTAARRTGEIGIRVAMGATQQNVLAMVLVECLVLAGVGVLAGVPIALALGRFARGLLFGVSGADPLTLACAAALMIGVAALAGAVPAWRASRLDPMVALRSE